MPNATAPEGSCTDLFVANDHTSGGNKFSTAPGLVPTAAGWRRDSGISGAAPEKFLETPGGDMLGDVFKIFTRPNDLVIRARGCELALSEHLPGRSMPGCSKRNA